MATVQELIEKHFLPILESQSILRISGLGFSKQEFDFQTNFQALETASRYLQAVALIKAAQKVANKEASLREVARLRKLSSPTSFKQDRLYSQLSDLIELFKKEFEIGSSEVTVTVSVPINRSEMEDFKIKVVL